MNELKPCPFCGGDAEIARKPWAPWRVYCTTCFSESSAEKEQSAIDKWNSRVQHENALYDSDTNFTITSKRYDIPSDGRFLGFHKDYKSLTINEELSDGDMAYISFNEDHVVLKFVFFKGEWILYDPISKLPFSKCSCCYYCGNTCKKIKGLPVSADAKRPCPFFIDRKDKFLNAIELLYSGKLDSLTFSEAVKVIELETGFTKEDAVRKFVKPIWEKTT